MRGVKYSDSQMFSFIYDDDDDEEEEYLSINVTHQPLFSLR